MIQKKSVLGAAAFFAVMALTVGWFALASDIGGKENPLVTLDYLQLLDPQIKDTIDAIVKEKVDAKIQEINELLQKAYDGLGDLPGGASLNTDDLLHNEAFINSLAAEIAGQISVGTGTLEAFSVRVVVETGQTLHLPEGSMVMLRLGTGTVAASNSPGLINLTTAGQLDNGQALVANNLYTVTMEAGRDIKCSARMTVFVWGPYIIR